MTMQEELVQMIDQTNLELDTLTTAALRVAQIQRLQYRLVALNDALDLQRKDDADV